jgi:hypothetical protein
MPDPIGIAQTVDTVNNLNLKSINDLILTNAIANQKSQQDEANSHRQAMNTLRESSTGQMVNKMNSLDTTEAAAIARVHRTPSGDSVVDVARSVALAKMVLSTAESGS